MQMSLPLVTCALSNNTVVIQVHKYNLGLCHAKGGIFGEKGPYGPAKRVYGWVKYAKAGIQNETKNHLSKCKSTLILLTTNLEILVDDRKKNQPYLGSINYFLYR